MQARTHRAKPSKKTRKHNRDRDKGKLYLARGVREKNRKLRAARHAKRVAKKQAHLERRAAAVTE